MIRHRKAPTYMPRMRPTHNPVQQYEVCYKASDRIVSSLGCQARTRFGRGHLVLLNVHCEFNR